MVFSNNSKTHQCVLARVLTSKDVEERNAEVVLYYYLLIMNNISPIECNKHYYHEKKRLRELEMEALPTKKMI
jgi:hypothetical protein